MEQVLAEPIELTESELDVVAGGDPFGNLACRGSFRQNSRHCHHLRVIMLRSGAKRSRCDLKGRT